MVLLLLQDIFGDEKRERAVLDSHFLNPSIEPASDLLPDEERMGLEVGISNGKPKHTARHYEEERGYRPLE
jgi:hypothetical protein